MTKTSTEIEEIDAPRALDRAHSILEQGGLVGIPTETVYGLAGDACSQKAVAAIFAAKGRPSHNPLICHVDGLDMAQQYASVSDLAARLMHVFWPGPLTLVVPLQADASLAPQVSAGLGTAALRCPAQTEVRRLITLLGRPLAAPSANPSGKLSPTTAQDVFNGLAGQLPLILDGGPTQIGLESTIVGVEDTLTILRPGTITAEEIEDTVGLPVHQRASTKGTVTAPGQLQSHYAPSQPVRINRLTATPEETLIGFGSVVGDFNLSDTGNLQEAASALYLSLRRADKLGKPIAVAPIPETGIGAAINDRLQRAAAPRES